MSTQQETTRTQELASLIQKSFPDSKVEYVKQKRIKVSIEPARIRELALFIRDTLGFDHISTVSGVDWIAKNQIEIIYFVETATKAGLEDVVLALSERINRENPDAISLIEVWPGAEYHEREVHEMLGVNFIGHPNQKHLLLPEDWDDLPPLRKDFISPGR